ncbi:hypothetical protein NF681_20965 (plasmid) [Comamonadaceae bacterium OTU4NAUVB1]|jgi:hypothetical protein|nr:hypothetical protein NF681_20965 [Comamonadaceae bacterium OTU4NAUVB1]HSU23546.1 hypothetical protein [Variovorax sp.]
MKQMILAAGTTLLLALGGLSAPAQAQPHGPGGRYDRPQVIVVQPPPPRYHAHPVHGPRYDHRYDDRYDHRFDHRRDRRAHRRDRDRDGVPDRHDRFPGNPYRR